MELTRRGYAVVGTSGTLLLVGVAGDRPLALVGASALCAFLLVAQYRAATRFSESNDALSVSVTAAQSVHRLNESGSLTVAVEFEETPHLPVSVAVAWPVGVDGERPALTVGPETHRSEATCAFSAPLGGQYEVPELTCTYTDGSGLFEQRVGRPERANVVVEAASPHDLRVGGGDFVAKLYGEHPSRQTRSGNDVVGIRRYVPGDPVTRIDWNSTARLGETHVREVEAKTSRRTRIFLDRHESMDDGPAGRRKSDYLREVVLGLLRALERGYDPVGLTLLDEDGIRLDTDIREATRHYRRCHRILNAERDRATTATDEGRRHSEGWMGLTPDVTRRLESRLSGRDDEFAATLRPFFEAPREYTQRFESKPLFNALRTKNAMERTPGWTVVCTDDIRPRETREAVNERAREGELVTVFLTPTVLFDTDSTDAERAYDRYVDFERFRKQLDAIPGVRAYEVAPGERRDEVLEAGRRWGEEGSNGGENRVRA